MIWQSIDKSESDITDCFRAAYLLWGVGRDELLERNRSDRAVKMRWIMFAALNSRGLSSNSIGKAFDRDHGTVLHGLQQGQDETDEEYLANYNAFQEEFGKIKRGGDIHPNTTSGYKTTPEWIIDRKPLTNIGGFSDYNPDEHSSSEVECQIL